jgi:DNA mismatch repair protein MutS
MKIIHTIKTLDINHLKVIYDKKEDKLIYDRKLEEGSGPAIYGLEVCKAMDLDASFLEMANSIRKELMQIQEIKPDTTSKYNVQLYIQKCMICGNSDKTMLETHHIHFQCHADEHHFIDHVHKDNLSNLVPLCKQCHQDVHTKNLEIYGYVQTSKGIELQYKKIEKTKLEQKIKKRKKFDDKQIEIILTYKKYSNLTKKEICYKLHDEHQIKISSTTLRKIFHGHYT